MTFCSGALGAADALDMDSVPAAMGCIIDAPVRAARTRRGLLP
ncbi:MAG: hypothetical protein ABSG20_24510 [Bradyrhizobium sp.]|jgi:hypothetical protein